MSSAATVARMTLGEAVWYARDLRGLTQLQLAGFLHISRPQVTNIEGDRFDPSIQTLTEIARALNVRFCTDGNYWEAIPA